MEIAPEMEMLFCDLDFIASKSNAVDDGEMFLDFVDYLENEIGLTPDLTVETMNLWKCSKREVRNESGMLSKSGHPKRSILSRVFQSDASAAH